MKNILDLFCNSICSLKLPFSVDFSTKANFGKGLLLILLFPLMVFGASSGSYISISGAGGNAAPILAVADNGYAFAAWIHFPNNIQAAFFNPNINSPAGQWTFLGTIAIGSVPSIGVDSTGNAFMTWVSTNAGPATQIFASRFDSTSLRFTSMQQISVTGTINFNPKLSVNGTGYALVIWMQDAPFQILSASFSPKTGLWSTAAPILSNVYPATFALDNFNRGIAIINNISGQVQGVIQAARLFVP